MDDPVGAGSTGSAPEVDVLPEFSLSQYGDPQMVVDGTSVTPPTQKAWELEIAPISTHVIDLDYVQSLDASGEVTQLLTVIRDVSVFRALLLEGWDAVPGRVRSTSRRMLHHAPTLVAFEVLEVAALQTAAFVLSVFTVEKSSGGG